MGVSILRLFFLPISADREVKLASPHMEAGMQIKQDSIERLTRAASSDECRSALKHCQLGGFRAELIREGRLCR